MDKSIVPINQIATRSSSCYEFSNPNEAVVVEIEDDDISVGIVERQMEELKLNYQFNEKNVPRNFKTLIKDRIESLCDIRLGFNESLCSLIFDNIQVLYEKNTHDWTITYKKGNTTVEMAGVVNPEESIIDHLWFVYRNPNIRLENFVIVARMNKEEESHENLNPEKMTKLLLSMFDSIDHQTQIYSIGFEGFNENVFLSMLKHVKPGKMEEIYFNISWKNEGNYQKMNEIAETDQWKQAKEIYSYGVTPLKIDEFFQYKYFCLQLDSVTPEDVLRVVEHAFNSSCPKRCALSCEHREYNIDAIIDVLRSQNDGSRITKFIPIFPQFKKFGYAIVKLDKRVVLIGNENCILIRND